MKFSWLPDLKFIRLFNITFCFWLKIIYSWLLISSYSSTWFLSFYWYPSKNFIFLNSWPLNFSICNFYITVLTLLVKVYNIVIFFFAFNFSIFHLLLSIMFNYLNWFITFNFWWLVLLFTFYSWYSFNELSNCFIL